MKKLVEVIAKNLVDNPEDVVVVENVDGKNVKLILSVNESDMGRVIGKQGKIAKAMRTVVKAAAMKEQKMVDVEIQ